MGNFISINCNPCPIWCKRLPELARGLGLGINEFRDAVDSSKKEIMDVIDSDKEDNKTSDSEE